MTCLDTQSSVNIGSPQKFVFSSDQLKILVLSQISNKSYSRLKLISKFITDNSYKQIEVKNFLQNEKDEQLEKIILNHKYLQMLTQQKSIIKLPEEPESAEDGAT